MSTTAAITIAIAILTAPQAAQESKPVPKDSLRVFVPGCTKGYVFTAGHRAEGAPGNVELPEGMHLRMNGPKKIMAEIKAHEGSMIEITGLMKKSQFRPDGVGLGGGVRMAPGPPSTGGGLGPAPMAGQSLIDVEGWRPIVGECPSR